MRLHEITDQNNVILVMKGLRLNFDREMTTAKSIKQLIDRSPGVVGKNYRSLFEQLLIGVNELLDDDTLDRSDPDVIDARRNALTVRVYISNVLTKL